MAEEGKPDHQLFQLLSNLLQQSVSSEFQTLEELVDMAVGLAIIESTIIGTKEGVRSELKEKNSIHMGTMDLILNFWNQMENHTSWQVEALTNHEEVELRTKIEALGLEVKKVPSDQTKQLDDLEIAKELDKLSEKLDDVDELISSVMAEDPQVQTLLSGTADIWMPVITATAEERRTFTASVGDEERETEENCSR